MGQIDDFLRAQVEGHLVTGEQIAYTGLLRNPTKFNKGMVGSQVPAEYEDWLALATTQRLFLFRTKPAGALMVSPKPLRLEDRVWTYHDLREVRTGTVAGLGSGVFFTLIPHEPLGPYEGEAKRYDVVAKANGCDQQAAMHQHFGTWLQQQVAAGVYPMDAERQARVAAHAEQQRNVAAAKQQADAHRQQERAARSARAIAGGRNWLIAAIVAFVALAGSVLMTCKAKERAASYKDMAAEGERSAKLDIYSASERARQASMAKDARDTQHSSESKATVFTGLSGVLLIGTVFCGITFRRKRHDQQASDGQG